MMNEENGEDYYSTQVLFCQGGSLYECRPLSERTALQGLSAASGQNAAGGHIGPPLHGIWA